MKKLSLFLVALAMLLVACKPEIEKPTVVTKSVGEITQTTAKIVGQVTEDGGAEVSERGVCWSTEVTPTIIDFRIVEGAGVGSFTSNISDLVPNTQYYVRTYATNEAGTAYGEEKTFTTLEVIPEEPGDEPEQPEEPGDEPEQPEEPEEPNVSSGVKTSEVTSITVNSAVCGGEVLNNGGATFIARGVCWSTNPNPTVSDTHTVDGNGIGVYTSNITNLEHNTVYYVKAYATDANAVTSYGEVKVFVTLEKKMPVVTTNSVSQITAKSAVCGGNITFDGNVAIVERGVCWSTEHNPTIEDNKTTDGSGNGSYTSNMVNLKDNTTYYVRAYATNEVGTTYGEEKSFTTWILQTEGVVAGHTWVDLGLPSGVKWATCNVGASYPEAYGNHYLWGWITPYDAGQGGTCKKGVEDISGTQSDVATNDWGNGWRIPTYTEILELKNNCTWKNTTQNGVNGVCVTGPNGKSIFIPYAGYYMFQQMKAQGEFGGIWSSHNANSYDSPYSIFLDGITCGRTAIDVAMSVRPVIDVEN